MSYLYSFSVKLSFYTHLVRIFIVSLIQRFKGLVYEVIFIILGIL